MKLFRRAKPERIGNLIKLYDDTVRVEKVARKGGNWRVYKLDDSRPFKRFIKVGEEVSEERALHLAKKV
jgi:hypothetical protein